MLAKSDEIDDVVYFANHKFGEIAYLVEDKDKYLLMTSSSKWKILKDDFPRFHCYVLYHSNNLSLEGFHRQSIGTNLSFLIFDAIRHDSPEMNKMSWEEFNRLWDMFLFGRKLEASMAAFNFLCE